MVIWKESLEQVTLSLILHKVRYPWTLRGRCGYVHQNTNLVNSQEYRGVLIGMLVDQGKMELDSPLGIEWLPKEQTSENDPRRYLKTYWTCRAVYIQIVVGWNTPQDLDFPIGQASSVNGARDRGLIRKPGTYWDYENYDTLLAVLAMKNALGDDKTYIEFPRKALFDKIEWEILLAPDRFYFSSQVYTNARILRFGLLYEQNGVWNGERSPKNG
jgi:hypothetical protein